MEKQHGIGLRTCRLVLACWCCWLFTAACENSSTPSTQNRPRVEDLRDEADRSIVHLYFTDKENAFLIAENRRVLQTNDPLALGTRIVQALLKGPQNAPLEPTIPEQTALNAFYLTENGVAFVDMSGEIRDNHTGGAKAELLTVYSIVNSLILNVHQIKAVKVLIDGREASTLAGHIDIRSPLKANMLMIR